MIDITTISQLEEFARSVAKGVRPGGVYGLLGELGAGKTTFVKHLAAHLGVTEEVISPTFIYQQTYSIPVARSQIKRFHHYDLYRLSSDADAEALGLDFDDPDGVHLVEWIDHAPRLGLRATQLLVFELQADGRRSVEVIQP